MNIREIKNDKFLKKMNEDELTLLASDIREFLISSISKTGGHLSSNLGVVELTIMLHKVFDFNKDKLIFDVSHQSYVHKILSGRADKFDTLRKFNGLSGFQKISEGDSYEAGHSGTSLSAGLGFALSRDMNKEKYNVISVIGDASISNGLSYEALNHIGEVKTKFIIILNDNEMSINKNVGALHNHLDNLRSNKHYESTKDKAKGILNEIPLIGKPLVRMIKNIKLSIKKLYLKEGFIFEELGLYYYGPINGHDFNELEMYLKRAKESTHPVILHVITEKGKGYIYSEKDTTGKWHGVGPFNKETGVILSSDTNPTWSEVISNNLIRLMKKNIVVITPAMESGSKLTKFKSMFPKNFIDVGIAEEHALVLANAMSLNKIIPFVSIYSSFLQRGYDQVLHDIARMNSHVIIGVDRCGLVGADGSTHQGVFDVSFLLPIPKLIISVPKDSVESANLLNTAIKTNSPFIIRYSKKRIEYKEEKITSIQVGSWEKITDGLDATLITYGDFVNESISVIDKLKSDGYIVSLVNARFLKPIDFQMFNEITNKNKPIFVYEESMQIGGLGSYLSSITDKVIITYAIKDEFVNEGTREELLEYLGLDTDTIYNKIKEVITSARVRK